MSTQITTSFTDGTSPAQDAWQSLVNRRLLMRGVYDHFAQMFTEKKSLGQRNGKTMIFRRYTVPTRQTTALTEGVTPTPISKVKTDVAITVAAYGAWMENSDFLMGSLPEGVLDDVDQLSQNMGETMDALYFSSIWATGTNVTYSNGSAEASVNTLALYEDYHKAVRSLVNNKAKRMTPMISASQKVGTGGVQPGYWCILSNSMYYDIVAGSTFSGKFHLPAQYASGSAITGEGGALDIGLRLLPVPDEAMTAGSMIVAAGGATGYDTGAVAGDGTNADVHYAVCIGQQAACSLDLGIGNGGIIRKALGQAGSADPLDQRASIGWKKYDGRGVLNQAFFQTVKAGVSV